MSKTPLTIDEIKSVISEIDRIGADRSIFVFNDEDHIEGSTCYNYFDDKVYVTRNVFPDDKYGSAHPRDIMSVGAVLAHEYYGHRAFRDEYLADATLGKDHKTTPVWQDECRASIYAAKTAKNLTDKDKADLIMDAIYRAQEYGQLIEMDDFMKEVLYGYKSDEKNISTDIGRITYVSKESAERIHKNGSSNYDLPEMWNTPSDQDCR